MSIASKSFVGVFDSGVGGLSVLRQLIKDFPNESFIYLGDTARLPYGAKSKETIKNYVVKNIDHLSSNYNLKAVVVACNSASSVLDELSLSIKTLGVIEAGIIAANKLSKTKHIALWATRATVSSQAYEKQALRLKTNLIISSTPCPTLVSLVEEGEAKHPLLKPAFDFYIEKSKLNADLSSKFGSNSKIDSLVLGCTHFPFFKKDLQNHLAARSLKIELVDSSKEVSNQLRQIITPESDGSPEHLILVTDEASHFKNFIDSKMPKATPFKVQKIDI